ncbi:hypothetical protein [Streptomyces sp. NPDC015125]|uniref:hypothetical protein n=1 Tax=Streptomyces sp. NPDC015125 TaxID=3364938 RepID=UPI0036F56249
MAIRVVTAVGMVVIGGMGMVGLGVMGAMGMMGLIMAVPVGALACHIAYRGTPTRLRLLP